MKDHADHSHCGTLGTAFRSIVRPNGSSGRRLVEALTSEEIKVPRHPNAQVHRMHGLLG
jgi:hypothetical protein